jgi:hypothetical protein
MSDADLEKYREELARQVREHEEAKRRREKGGDGRTLEEALRVPGTGWPSGL